MRSPSSLLALGAAIVAAGCATQQSTTRRTRRRIRASNSASRSATPTSRRGTSTSAPPTARACRSAAAPWRRARPSTTRSASRATAPTRKAARSIGTMVGGIGSFKTNTRVLTPGSMYPYAPILFDYIRRAMPMDHPQSLTTNEIYAVSAYILNLNGIIPDERRDGSEHAGAGADAEPQRIHRRRPAGYEGGALHDELQVIRCAGAPAPARGPGRQWHCRPFACSLARRTLRDAMRDRRQSLDVATHKTEPTPYQEDAT